MIIAVDFDGTCVTHEYPNVGKNIGAAPVLRALVENGHKIMLWTMRDHKTHTVKKFVDGHYLIPTTKDCLQEAIDWFTENDIKLWGVNENPEQSWSDSHKQYAHYYIDDTALGVPLTNGHVNWNEMLVILHNNGLINTKQVTDILHSEDWVKETWTNY